ncbi:MAG: DUF262 domain-containing protein [Synergistaceae bacterium]|nr:DUF262 domain-containing protein [Synergistaceae bacterium]
MSISLSIEQKTILALLSDKSSYFLIPDYQRPYAWEENECATLWNDIHSFALPDNDYSKFNENDVYFLGPIVLFTNSDGKLEVIDGQQRLTTLMLLLRAFYRAYGNDMQDSKSITVKNWLEQCLWKTDEFGEPDKSALKIESETATDNDKGEFVSILLEGDASDKLKSRYAENYRFFQEKINDFKVRTPDYFSHLPVRILRNCILLPIHASTQDAALRIFSTLNDRGKPLSDSDIFKAQLYRAFSGDGKKDEFIEEWKQLENVCGKIFRFDSDNPMDEIFTRYMYFARAKRGIKISTLEGLRKFYESDNYSLLRKYHERTFSNLITLAEFWNDIANQDGTKFSDRVLRRLFVLNYAPNRMWTYITSVYFLHNRDSEGLLDDERFYTFLNRITAFIWAFTILRPGVNLLRTPLFAEMFSIVHGKESALSDYVFSLEELQNTLRGYGFTNNRPITRSMLAWYAFNDEGQELLPIETVLEIEHIYARNRTPIPANIEALGNKSLLEKKINIRASDYRFKDKAKYYLGLMPKKPATNIHELQELARTQNDFTEQDISERTEKIISAFMAFIKANNLARN